MLTFTEEWEFSGSLDRLGFDIEGLMSEIQQACHSRAAMAAKGYAVLRLDWEARHLLVWYLANGSAVTLLSIHGDPAD
jgi:hypothetical protein